MNDTFYKGRDLLIHRMTQARNSMDLQTRLAAPNLDEIKMSFGVNVYIDVPDAALPGVEIPYFYGHYYNHNGILREPRFVLNSPYREDLNSTEQEEDSGVYDGTSVIGEKEWKEYASEINKISSKDSRAAALSDSFSTAISDFIFQDLVGFNLEFNTSEVDLQEAMEDEEALEKMDDFKKGAQSVVSKYVKNPQFKSALHRSIRDSGFERGCIRINYPHKHDLHRNSSDITFDSMSPEMYVVLGDINSDNEEIIASTIMDLNCLAKSSLKNHGDLNDFIAREKKEFERAQQNSPTSDTRMIPTYSVTESQRVVMSKDSASKRARSYRYEFYIEKLVGLRQPSVGINSFILPEVAYKKYHVFRSGIVPGWNNLGLGRLAKAGPLMAKLNSLRNAFHDLAIKASKRGLIIDDNNLADTLKTVDLDALGELSGTQSMKRNLGSDMGIATEISQGDGMDNIVRPAAETSYQALSTPNASLADKIIPVPHIPVTPEHQAAMELAERELMEFCLAETIDAKNDARIQRQGELNALQQDRDSHLEVIANTIMADLASSLCIEGILKFDIDQGEYLFRYLFIDLLTNSEGELTNENSTYNEDSQEASITQQDRYNEENDPAYDYDQFLEGELDEKEELSEEQMKQADIHVQASMSSDDYLFRPSSTMTDPAFNLVYNGKSDQAKLFYIASLLIVRSGADMFADVEMDQKHQANIASVSQTVQSLLPAGATPDSIKKILEAAGLLKGPLKHLEFQSSEEEQPQEGQSEIPNQ